MLQEQRALRRATVARAHRRQAGRKVAARALAMSIAPTVQHAAPGLPEQESASSGEDFDGEYDVHASDGCVDDSS